MIRFAVLLSTAAVLAGCNTLTPQPDFAEVEAAERARFQAWTTADTAAMRDLLADDLVYCHSNGRCQSKQELIADFDTGNIIYRKLDIVSFKPRAVGGAVLVNGAFDLVAESGGQTARFQGIYTDVYVRRDGRWQMVSWQSTRIP